MAQAVFNDHGSAGVESLARNENLNNLIIYVIPSKVKYDWSSPRSLYKSYIKNAWRNMLSKKNYSLGHAFLDLDPTGDEQRVFTGMRSVSKKEKRELVFKEHYGLAILGAGLSGRLEKEEELEEKLALFSRKGQLAFLMVSISDAATNRLLDFFRLYKDNIVEDSLSERIYGGAFWPRYYGEGAGCSAFVISFLDVAGLLKDEFGKWLVKIDIPMDLIGGPYNHNRKVKLKDIKKEESWADAGNSLPPGYEHLEMYDPTLMFEWIHQAYDAGKLKNGYNITPMDLEKAKGIYLDLRNEPLPENENIFLERESPSLFIH